MITDLNSGKVYLIDLEQLSVPMKLWDAINMRRSVRSFLPKAIPEEKLRRVLDAGRLAPSAGNRQPWKFVVVKNRDKRRAFSLASNNQMFVGEAPAIIIGVALNPDYVMSCDVPSYPIDLAIAFDHITLAAVAEGLGTCWIGAFSQHAVKRLLKIPKKYKVVTIMPIGYPADTSKPKSRKNLAQVVCHEEFKE